MSTWSIVGILAMAAGILLALVIGVIRWISVKEESFDNNKAIRKIFMAATLMAIIGAAIMCLVMASK